MATINITDWGIVEGEAGLTNAQKDARALANSEVFICNFRGNTINNGDTIWLPEGTYLFSMMYFQNKENITFYGELDANGEPKSKIKFRGVPGGYTTSCNVSWPGSPAWFKVSNANDFLIKDLELTSTYNQNDPHNGTNRYAHSGYIWVERKSHGGLLKNLRVYDAGHSSISIGSQGYIPAGDPNNVHDIDIENCIVKGQRLWVEGTSKASIIAGGGADNITFKNCTVYANGKYKSTVSPANMFGCDDATNVEFRNCEAVGSNQTQGSTAGFWVEGEHQSDTTLYNCTITKTDGGLGVSDEAGLGNSAEAHNCTFIKANNEHPNAPWSAWTHGGDATLELYGCIFDDCYYAGGAHAKGGIVGDAGYLTVEDCQFINTDGGENVSFYAGGANLSKIEATLKNNEFDQGIRGYSGQGYGTINLIANDLLSGANYIKGGAYTWNEYKSAETDAINGPTSNTTVYVSYDGHTTQVNYTTGTPLYAMAYIMANAINNDSGAKLTASTESNIIKFVQKYPNMSDNSISFFIDSGDWIDGNPFNPMYPTMS